MKKVNEYCILKKGPSARSNYEGGIFSVNLDEIFDEAGKDDDQPDPDGRGKDDDED